MSPDPDQRKVTYAAAILEGSYNTVILIKNIVYRNLRHHTVMMVVHCDRLALYLRLMGTGNLERAVPWEHWETALPGLCMHLVTFKLFCKPLS